MRYGVSYKGSKNAISEWVVKQFPKKINFYDLFAGGCAVTHYAMLTNKFKTFTINDIDNVTELFLDAINGKYQDENRWISREDFSALKDTEPYIRYCWSFGNNGVDYLYSKEVEPWRKALHFARLFGDLSLFREFGIATDGTSADIIKNQEEYKKKYIIWYCKNVLSTSLNVLELQKDLNDRIERNSKELRNYLITGLKKAGKRPSDVDRYLETNGMAGHYFGQSQWEFPTREAYIKLQSFIDLPLEYEKIYGLQELLESLKRLESLEGLQRLQSLESFRGSYDKVLIKPDSVIYCDIPYRNTDAYGEEGFDYERFYDWCERQTEPLFISEYWMPPERFECVASIEKSVLLCSGGGKKTVEKLFVPKVQIKNKIAVIKKKEIQQEFDF